MRLRIQKADGTVKVWVAKTARGFNKKQIAEIEKFRHSKPHRSEQ